MVRPREQSISNCSSIVLKSLSAILLLLVNKSFSSVRVFPQKSEGDVK